jgi:hypothetical protein
MIPFTDWQRGGTSLCRFPKPRIIVTLNNSNFSWCRDRSYLTRFRSPTCRPTQIEVQWINELRVEGITHSVKGSYIDIFLTSAENQIAKSELTKLSKETIDDIPDYAIPKGVSKDQLSARSINILFQRLFMDVNPVI